MRDFCRGKRAIDSLSFVRVGRVGCKEERSRGASSRERREMSPTSLVKPTRGQNVSEPGRQKARCPQKKAPGFRSCPMGVRDLSWQARWPRVGNSPAPADTELQRDIHASGTAALPSRANLLFKSQGPRQRGSSFL